ncbi:MAG: hypothetical protein ABIJ91_02540 [Candidatus Kuenenbacteria bacterium]
MEKEQLSNEQIAELYAEKVEQETNPELKTVAKNVIDCYNFQPEKESLLVITDTKVMQDNPLFITAVEQELKARTSQSKKTVGNYEIVVIPASPYSATPLEKFVGDKMKNRPTLIVTSMSRSHSVETADAHKGVIPAKEEFDKIINSHKLQKLVEKEWSTIPLKRLTELKNDEEDEYYDELKDLAQKTRSRIVSITKGHNPFEILTKGAVEESVEVLREKAEKVDQLMRNVEQVHITTDLGTDLTLRPRSDKTEVEDGRMDKPGKVSNYPIGEWSCSPYLEGANGKLVVDIAAGGNHNQDQFDEHGPVSLNIEDGIVISMGDKNTTWKLDELKNMLSENTDYDLLEKKDPNDHNLVKKQKAERMQVQGLVDEFFDDKDIDNPLIKSILKYWIMGDNRDHHCFRLAEFAVGTNTKACRNKEPKDIGSSEGEKIYGTTHIAIGANGTFGVAKTDPNYNNSQIHCDMVISKPTIECTKEDGSKFNLIENGKPIGY